MYICKLINNWLTNQPVECNPIGCFVHHPDNETGKGSSYHLLPTSTAHVTSGRSGRGARINCIDASSCGNLRGKEMRLAWWRGRKSWRERERERESNFFKLKIHGYYITSLHVRNNFHPPKNYSILANWQHRLLSNSSINFYFCQLNNSNHHLLQQHLVAGKSSLCAEACN